MFPLAAISSKILFYGSVFTLSISSQIVHIYAVGSVDSLLAACLNVDLHSAADANAARVLSAKPSKGKDILKGLNLSKDQIKALALLPFSSRLGVDEAFSFQAVPATQGNLLSCTKVKLDNYLPLSTEEPMS